MNPFILSFQAKSLDAAIHKHSAFQIVISHDGSFHARLDNEDNKDIFGFIVKPQIPHSCRENTNLLSIINIEPFSPVGVFIERLFRPGVNYIPFKGKNEIFNYLPIEPTGNLEKSINQIASINHSPSKLDERITSIINYIHLNYAQKLNLKILSNLVHLSPSRLSSLFKGQTGSSLSRYILWTRIRHAIHLSLSTKKTQLTDIAFQTGFYDLPQLNKYMYDMIGVPPKGFRNNSDLIQVL